MADTGQAGKYHGFSKDRLGRVWAYFQPDLIGPRVRKPAEDVSTHGEST